MSGEVAGRERVNPRRARSTHAMQKTPWPWHDRSGRFSWLKTTVLACELAPAAWIAFGLLTHRFGARPLTEAIHQAGLWAFRFLLLSLLVSPLRSIFTWHRLMLVRRQLGLAALFYGLAHLALYGADENWHMATVAMEILSRFYLEVGFVALVGLGVLGVTSTDHVLRQLGHGWKRLHRLVYPLAALAALHYFLQAKADVAEPLVMAGLFLWMMGWRLLPSGWDRAPLPVLALSVTACVLTGGLEYLWYRLGTRINPLRVLTAETDWQFGPHPAGQVLLLALGMTVATALAWAHQRERMRRTLGFHVALYAGVAASVMAAVYAFTPSPPWLPDAVAVWQGALAVVVAAAALGALRRAWPQRRRLLDVVCGVAVVLPLLAGLAG